MYEWQPKETVGGTLVLSNRGYGSTVTDIHCSEGDTLFIRQIDGTRVERTTITRHELYDIIFNFMSTDELVKIANLKINPNYELRVKSKNN